jgi:hypothetical protein
MNNLIANLQQNDTDFPFSKISPPSDSGISLLSPAPLAAEPYVTLAPGNFFSTEASTPDSAALKFISCALFNIYGIDAYVQS